MTTVKKREHAHSQAHADGVASRIGVEKEPGFLTEGSGDAGQRVNH